MDQTEYAHMGTIIRGLYLGSTGTPWIVVYENRDTPPSEAIIVDISFACKEGHFDEGGAAKILHEAFTAWEFEMAPAGVEAMTKTENIKKYPSCVALKSGNTVEALYWIDRNIDAARKRQAAQDASLLEEGHPRIPRTSNTLPPGMDAAHRAEVVKNRVALVIGDPGDLSDSIVRGLALSGALVYVAGPNRETVEKLATQINQAERKTAAIPLQVDIRDEGSIQEMFKTIEMVTGGIDLCIGTTDLMGTCSVLEQELDEFEGITKQIYTAFFILVKHSARLLRRQHRTAPDWKTDIIHVNVTSDLEGSNKNGAFAGGNYGVLGLTASFALELVEYNIKINAVCPGERFDSPYWSDHERGIFAENLRSGKIPGARSIGEVRAFYEAKIPMKRSCSEADVMRGIFYLVEQEYETGQALPVTGGKAIVLSR